MRKIKGIVSAIGLAFTLVLFGMQAVGAQNEETPLPPGVKKQGEVPGKGSHKGWEQGQHKGWDKNKEHGSEKEKKSKESSMNEEASEEKEEKSEKSHEKEEHENETTKSGHGKNKNK